MKKLHRGKLSFNPSIVAIIIGLEKGCRVKVHPSEGNLGQGDLGEGWAGEWKGRERKRPSFKGIPCGDFRGFLRDSIGAKLSGLSVIPLRG